ncbi:MAG: hypothetical protein A3K19_14070 [Lentisphaerae bacterium RIFOXYB12_FULL_65_16]|nr:MAG: hypothetical protein A3K18_16415 [Lentisphaerae bacterium RIFOXYA12_64_32]OGV89094.1 MAG: hypothetical protein A3K19_14070 [Lentisphaerae bacterium RIFOXYB12_FULL_65_16]
MRTALFPDTQFEQMASEVRRVLAEVGYAVDHPEVKALAWRAGCRESGAGRVLFDSRQIDELRAELLRQYPPPTASDTTLVHPPREIRAAIGNITPKVYDHASGQAVGGTLAVLQDIVKFVQAEPRVTGVTLPVSRQDVPPAVEQMDSLVAMAKLTSKPLGAIDATVPESVPYLAEMGAVLGHAPAAFVGSCNCINPPLRLEARTAETMLQRRCYHSRSMITPMPCIGGSGPVDIHGSVVQGTAEIVGGLILSRIIDPEAPLLGYIACNQVDMLTGNGTSCTPQTVRVDAGVYQLMEYAFGGGTRVGGRSYINARRPGLQAVFERFLKALGYAALVDKHWLSYAGGGCLENGSTISVEQFLLDIEVLSGLDSVWTTPVVASPGDAVERIRETVLNGAGNFLSTDHTLAHFRDEMWTPHYFRCGTATATENEIVDRCHAEYRRAVESYQPASHPVQVVRELERILQKARRDLVG